MFEIFLRLKMIVCHDLIGWARVLSFCDLSEFDQLVLCHMIFVLF